MQKKEIAMFAQKPLDEGTCSSVELHDGTRLVNITVLVDGQLNTRDSDKALISGVMQSLELLTEKEFEAHLYDGSVIN